MELAAFI